MKADVIVVGAGAAGLMCAIEAGKRGRIRPAARAQREHRRKNPHLRRRPMQFHQHPLPQPENFISENPSFAKSALSRYTPGRLSCGSWNDTSIPWHEKKSGQLFCDGSSREILAMLRKECERRSDVRIAPEIAASRRCRKALSWKQIEDDFECASLVIATGGLSIPKLGATDFGYRVARQFGLRVTALRPGLVPLLFDEPKDVARTAWCVV